MLSSGNGIPANASLSVGDFLSDFVTEIIDKPAEGDGVHAVACLFRPLKEAGGVLYTFSLKQGF